MNSRTRREGGPPGKVDPSRVSQLSSGAASPADTETAGGRSRPTWKVEIMEKRVEIEDSRPRWGRRLLLVMVMEWILTVVSTTLDL